MKKNAEQSQNKIGYKDLRSAIYNSFIVELWY